MIQSGKPKRSTNNIKRATYHCEDLAERYGASDWVAMQRERKWKLAGKTANRTDSRWSTRLLTWTPWFRVSPRRTVGRPRMRWDDDLVKIAGEAWATEALDLGMWQSLCAGYVNKVY